MNVFDETFYKCYIMQTIFVIKGPFYVLKLTFYDLELFKMKKSNNKVFLFMNLIENFNNHAISSNKMKNIVLKYNILFFIKHYKACLICSMVI